MRRTPCAGWLPVPCCYLITNFVTTDCKTSNNTTQAGRPAPEVPWKTCASGLLTGIATRYGKDSSEYEKAGGTKKSGIKRKKAASATAVPKA